MSDKNDFRDLYCPIQNMFMDTLKIFVAKIPLLNDKKTLENWVISCYCSIKKYLIIYRSSKFLINQEGVSHIFL